jgi:15-cis-phytoene desaturase
MPSVAIFGGGVGGLTTAHELVERGFEVEVFDLKTQYWGGKARSDTKDGSGTGGRADLPGEHGFRFFPGFYKHLPDTLSRIPFPGNANGVLDNLVPTTEFALYQENGPPYVAPVNFPTTIKEWGEVIKATFISHFGISEANIDFFVGRLLKLAGICQPRLDYEYDTISWWDFVEAEKRGVEYQKVLAQGLTRSLVAIQAEESSTRTVGTMFLQLVYDMITPGVQTDRVLNGPTNDQWLNAWTIYLIERGVALNLNSTATSFNMNGAELGSVTVNVNGAVRDVIADFYVSAVPAEKMAVLLTPAMLAAAPDLAKIRQLKTEWMNGIQFYLSTDVPIVPGHVVYTDSTWAITSISQHQFWKGVPLSDYGNGHVRGILSADISDWQTKGNKVVFKAANDCSAEEIKTESWAQIKAHLGDLLKDSYLVDWYLDPDIVWGHLEETRDANKEPLLINRVGSLQLRPAAATQIPNLMLAADYVNTYTNLACMEGANEAGRRAANAILDATGYGGSRCSLWPYESPWVFKVEQAADQVLWDLTHHGADSQPVITS